VYLFVLDIFLILQDLLRNKVKEKIKKLLCQATENFFVEIRKKKISVIHSFLNREVVDLGSLHKTEKQRVHIISLPNFSPPCDMETVFRNVARE
jgi:hypothetical protein